MAKTLDKKKPVDSRFEIVFLYDVEDGNPNGDPLAENRPRIDEETGQNLVTDVRLKRTVRDYFVHHGDEETDDVFIRPVENDNGELMTREELVQNGLGKKKLKDASKKEIKEILLERFIDLRLFGATLSVKDHAIGLTGPVQFKIGRSLHKVDTRYIQQSVTLPSEKKKKQGTFADRYDLPYSLIRFYGLVNENTASETGLTRRDLYRLAEGMWKGTKSLITHSKMAHKPQMLVLVEYKEPNYHIGGIDSLIGIKVRDGKEETAIRTFSDVELETDKLKKTLEKHKDKIKRVYLQSDVPVELSGIKTEPLGLE